MKRQEADFTEGEKDQKETPAALSCDPDQAFFVIRGEGGGEILEEAGTFSGQALLLSYPYPRGGGVQSRRQAPTHHLVHSTYPPLVHAAQGWNRYFTLNLFPHKISTCSNLLWLAP